MAGAYKVVSLIPDCASITKIDHGDFGSYAAAASVARIVRKIWPSRTSLVQIPKVKSDKIEFAAPDVYDFESEPFHW